MIGSLKGKITNKGLDWIELETGGIGWTIYLPPGDFSKAQIGDNKEFFIYHYVAEAASDLYGFSLQRDREVFGFLLSVNGVGPRTALGVFAVGNGERILRAIAEADVAFFQQVKGIGRKGAQRIIVDLKTKVGEVKSLDLRTGQGGNEEVYQALRNLGFQRAEIDQALRDLPQEVTSTEEIVKFALQKLGKNYGR